MHVIAPPQLGEQLNQYCDEQGIKRQSLITRLIGEYLERGSFPEQLELFRHLERKIGRRGE